MASWQVQYQPGTLKAVGYKGKKQVSISELKTAGDPVKIKMTADRQVIRADGQDLCYITVELTDANGVRDPRAENTIRFEASGPAKIIATGNANPVSTESYQSHERKGWHGRCLVIVKSEGGKGRITVKASSQGLETGVIEIESK